MHKRNKGKNKQKNPNPIPPQQVAAPVKEQESVKEDERVPEIVPEAVKLSPDYEDAGPADQTPAKPKRHRAGKKRKQNENKEDNNASEEASETIGDVKNSEEIATLKDIKDELPVKNEKGENTTEPKEETSSKSKEETKDITIEKPAQPPVEEQTVTPVARKKKGKQNKNEPEKTIEAVVKEPPPNQPFKETPQNQPIKEEGFISIKDDTIINMSTSSVDSLDKNTEKPIKTTETRVESDDCEQKGSKKKDKKNKKSNALQETEKTAISIEKPVPKPEVVELKIELRKESSPSMQENLKVEEIVEAAKTEDQNICENKLEQHETECTKGKKRNKKDKRLAQEKQYSKSIDVIIEDPVSESNIEKHTQYSNKQAVEIKSPQETSPQIQSEQINISNVPENVTSMEITAEEEKHMECAPLDPPMRELPQDTPQKNSESIPNVDLTGDDDNNNIVSEQNTPVTEEIIITEFEKLLASKSDIEIAAKDLTCPKYVELLPENIEPESRQFTPLCESNIDESCKKLFEALLVTDKPLVSESQIKGNIDSISSIPENKKEEFIIRLFEKSITEEKSTKEIPVNVEKLESKDLKEKVMEVNKDMEDLKMSIEKSIAELTAIEADDMPELVAITDCQTPPEEMKQEEAITVVNVETQILPIPKDILPPIPIPTSLSTVQSVKIEETHIEIKKEKTDLYTRENDKPKNITMGIHHQKHKGKGKTSKVQDPMIIVNLETEESAPRNQSPIITPNINEAPVEEIKISEPEKSIIELTPNVQGNEEQTSSHDPKGKGKGKNKKKNKNEQAIQQNTNSQVTHSQQSTQIQGSESRKNESAKSSGEDKEAGKESEKQKVDHKDTKTASDQEITHNKDESEVTKSDIVENKSNSQPDSDRVENFEDALTSSIDDTFEEITKENGQTSTEQTSFVIPIENKDMLFNNQVESSETKPPEEKKQVENPLSTRPKNLLGHPDIPVTSSKNDYKKEKNKNIQTPNAKHARIKVKDSVDIENNQNAKKCSKQSQTDNKIKSIRQDKSSSPGSDEEEEYVYKYSFRKVFLTNSCSICKIELRGRRLTCGYCNLVFYCCENHKDEDWPQHQALCFAVSTIVRLKGLKSIYEDARGVSGQDYRLLRMQVIVSCEKILKRKLLPCEQEILLYPRLCCESSCREWKHDDLTDCDGCGLVSYCTNKPQHLVRDHKMWCKSYRLYFKLVTHQQSKGRLEPRLPSKVIEDLTFTLPDKINELLARVYEEEIDMNDIHYAALTQLATAPLTAAFSHQLFKNSLDNCTDISNGHQDKIFTLHVVGAELQFEADTLNKWEVFFLHLRPDIQELRVVFIGPELNPSKLPLDLLAKIKMCKQCRQDKRRILFDYRDGQLYHNYVASDHFTTPDIVCAFNPGLHRITGFGGVDSWPETINCIIKQKIPFCVTSYTKYELPRDLIRIRECSNYQYKMILEPSLNPYASIRPDRNFISDDEMPLIFKNYYFMVLTGMN